MLTLTDFYLSLVYVSNASYFWQSMGAVVACSVFIGAILYNGDLDRLSKGIVTTGAYASLLFTMTISRVLDTFSRTGVRNADMALAGSSSILIVTLFYFMGLIIGVYLVKFIHRNQHYH